MVCKRRNRILPGLIIIQKDTYKRIRTSTEFQEVYGNTVEQVNNGVIHVYQTYIHTAPQSFVSITALSAESISIERKLPRHKSYMNNIALTMAQHDKYQCCNKVSRQSILHSNSGRCFRHELVSRESGIAVPYNAFH